MAAEAVAAEAFAIAAALDAGEPLTELQHKAIIDELAAQLEGGQPEEEQAPTPLVDAVNAIGAAGGARPPARIVLLGNGSSVQDRQLIEHHLVPLHESTGRLGILIAMPEALQQKKKRRADALPDGISYDGNSFGGRVNFQPSQPSAVAIIGKRSASWRRMQSGALTHNITGHEVRRVVPVDPLPHWTPAAGIEMDGQGNTTVHTAAPHTFSGAKQLVAVAGLEAGLNGSYAVVQADPNKAPTAFKIKMAQQPAETAELLRQRAQQGDVSFRQERILDTSWTLYHFMLTGPAELLAAQPQQEQQEQQGAALVPAAKAGEEAALMATAETAAAVAVAAPPGLPLIPPMPLFAHDMPDLHGLHAEGMPPTGGFSQLLGLHSHMGVLSSQGYPAAAATGGGGQPGATGGSRQAVGSGAAGQPAVQSSQGQLVGGAADSHRQPALPASPADSSSGGHSGQARPPTASGEHAQREGHYSLLTVGGEEALAGRGQFEGKALVVLGDGKVTGDLTAQGVYQVSDARAKEGIRALDEGKKAVAIAADIATFVYKYKGSSAQRVGVVAQQVQAVLERHKAADLGIVRKDAQGQLAVDYGGLQTILLAAMKQALADAAEVKESHITLQLAALGRIQNLEATVKQLQRLQAAGSSSGGLGGAAVAGSASSASLASSAYGGGHLSSSASMAMLLDGGDVEMSGCSESDMEADGAVPPLAGEEEEGGSREPFAGEFTDLTNQEAVELLVGRLEEQKGVHKLLLKLVSDLSRPALYEVYQQAVSEPRELTAAGDRPRALGGQFIKLAKQRIAADKLAAKARHTDEAHQGPHELRGYQQRVVEAAKEGGNLVYVAPTGSGKTAPAVAYTVHVLQRDPAARVAFVAPTVPLAQQQAAAFLKSAEFRGGNYRVACFTSDNQLAPRDWAKALQENHVLVLTPQMLVNNLEAGAASIGQLALLVLDECHHATGEHSVNKILKFYHASERTTQILGLTASPASKATLESTYHALHTLKDNLDARFMVLDDRDPELVRLVPVVEEEQILVDVAAEDLCLARRLGVFVVDAVQLLYAELDGLLDQAPLPVEVTLMLQEGRWCSTAARWTVTAAEWLQGAAEAAAADAAAAAGAGPDGPTTSAPAGAAATDHDATCALLLVRAAVAALALVSDVGFEAAVRHISQQYYVLSSRVALSPGTSGSPASPGSVGASGPMPLTSALLQQLARTVEEAGVLPEAFSCGSGALSRHPKIVELKRLLLELHTTSSSRGSDSSQQQQQQQQPQGEAAEAGDEEAQAQQAQQAQQGGGFHGIVFARTREAVRSITALVASSPDLQFLQVYAFMGHGNRRGGGFGMTSKEQQAVMEEFRQPGGCRLLVSTSAGEEGIDVPRCEVVIRFTAAQTGRERVQSAGRARKHGSRFVEIIERSSAELAAVRKSVQEAANMREALKGMTQGIGGLQI